MIIALLLYIIYKLTGRLESTQKCFSLETQRNKFSHKIVPVCYVKIVSDLTKI